MNTKTKSGPTHSETRNRRYAKDLLISGKEFADIMDNVSYGVFVFNIDWYLVYSNDEFLKILCITQDQINSKHFLDIVVPEYHERAKKYFQRVMKGEKIHPHEMGCTSTEGQIKIVDVINSRPIYKGGKIVGLQGVILNVGKHKRVEEALRKSESMITQHRV